MKNQESRVGPEQEIESVPQYETSAKNQVSNNQSIKTKKKIEKSKKKGTNNFSKHFYINIVLGCVYRLRNCFFEYWNCFGI